MGNAAQDGWRRMLASRPDLVRYEVVRCAHPAPRSINRPGVREQITRAFADSQRLIQP